MTNPAKRPAILCLLSPSAVQGVTVFSEEKLLGHLSAGDQDQAEAEVLQAIKDGERSPRAIFWAAVLGRSRFDIQSSLPMFAQLLATQPESLEGRASGFVLGIDTAKDIRTELFYYNALVAQTSLEPKSVPLQWLSGIMARTITKDSRRSDITSETRKRTLAWGVESYWKTLSLLGVQQGPYRIHQTLANLLDDLEAHDHAHDHRKIALTRERTAMTLHGIAKTLQGLFQNEEALSYIDEAIALDSNIEKYHWTKGDILQQRGRMPEAIQAWNAAAELATTYKSFYWDLCSRAEPFHLIWV
jgi:tetratricopeptide (TPR) repeat protein